MADEIFQAQTQTPNQPTPKRLKPQVMIAIGVGAVVIGALLVWIFVFDKKLPSTNENTNGTQNVNITLPENHTITEEERTQLGIDTGLEGEIKYTLVNGSVMSYFEITKDNRPQDTDGDTLSDSDEVKYKTDAKLADTDKDEFFDGYEVKYGCDPTKADTDADGLSDFDEFTVYHSDCTKKDTDDDSLTDQQEVNTYKSDPLKKDTDSDGNDDGTEVKNGFNPIGEGKL